MGRKKKIPPCIDVIGRKVTWKPANSARLYGEVVHVDYEHYKPEKPLYEKQRFLRKHITVYLNDGRMLRFPAEQEDVKRMGLVADA